MNLLCGFYYERGLAFILKTNEEEYNSIPESVEPKIYVDKEEDKVLIDFVFIKLPYTLFDDEKLIGEFELIFLLVKENEFYCSKTVLCKLTKELIIEARGMQKALESFQSSFQELCASSA